MPRARRSKTGEGVNFIADLHIHSRFSLATSKQLSVATLDEWARLKGINVLGTADFTHPKWREELRRDLVYDEEYGLYRSKRGANAGDETVFFCPQTEISCIYKKGGKVRKVHNLVFMPTLEAADIFSRKLGAAGNINSDGRPILGLDSRDLLEMALESSPEAALIPAHIWTPWFSLFGSRSGFDALEDCYGDLSAHIFALETGLSSDPEMNRLLSALDNYALISNSDAHSGANLGREANIFAGIPSYSGIFSALRKSARRERQADDEVRFMGTLEFHPEEGKYHLDGHRECGVVLSPAESRELGNICPKCGKPLTIGVLHRVMELADRETAPELPREPESRLLVPLAEIIGEIFRSGSGSRKVRDKYMDATSRLGPELEILSNKSIEEIGRYWEPLGEAIRRLRFGETILDPGYDGQFGTVRLFRPEETAEFSSRAKLFAPASIKKDYVRETFEPRAPRIGAARPIRRILSEEQQAAINAGIDPHAVIAGPGAGKTACLVERAERLAREGAAPEEILIVTFTRRAARELKERLASRGDAMKRLVADTLHGMAYSELKTRSATDPVILNEDEAFRAFASVNSEKSSRKIRGLWASINRARETCDPLTKDEEAAFARYLDWKNGRYLDYTDLLEWALENASFFRNRYKYVMVDEIQDLSPLQINLLRAILPERGEGFFGIGDPDQAIYAFRGAHPDVIGELRKAWPSMKILKLSRGYRSAENILDLARSVLGSRARGTLTRADGARAGDLKFFEAENEFSEADWIAKNIKKFLGPTSHTLGDGGKEGGFAPEDIAILVRKRSQIEAIGEALNRRGIPWSAPVVEDFCHDENCAKFLDYARSSGGSSAPDELLASMPEGIVDREILTLGSAFRELRDLWRDCGSWDRFFAELGWRNEAERVGARAGKVRVLTLHSSKGLEFEKVFIPGLEADGRENEVEAGQERNLLYTGITRAASGVYLSRCRERLVYGKKASREPSPLLEPLKSRCAMSRETLRTKIVASDLNLFGGEEK